MAPGVAVRYCCSGRDKSRTRPAPAECAPRRPPCCRSLMAAADRNTAAEPPAADRNTAAVPAGDRNTGSPTGRESDETNSGTARYARLVLREAAEGPRPFVGYCCSWSREVSRQRKGTRQRGCTPQTPVLEPRLLATCLF